MPEAVFLSYFYRTEREIASRLRGLLDHVSRIDPEKISKAVEREEARQSLTLSQEQREAVESACGHKVSIITGGPGTGKTTITRVVVRALKALGLKISWPRPRAAPPSVWPRPPGLRPRPCTDCCAISRPRDSSSTRKEALRRRHGRG